MLFPFCRSMLSKSRTCFLLLNHTEGELILRPPVTGTGLYNYLFPFHCFICFLCSSPPLFLESVFHLLFFTSCSLLSFTFRLVPPLVLKQSAVLFLPLSRHNPFGSWSGYSDFFAPFSPTFLSSTPLSVHFYHPLSKGEMHRALV